MASFLRVLMIAALATGAAAADSACTAEMATKVSEDLTACGTTTQKCATDAGSDVDKICKCGDESFDCMEKAYGDCLKDDTWKTQFDTAKKSYEDSKEAQGCDSSSGDFAAPRAQFGLAAVATAAAGFLGFAQ